METEQQPKWCPSCQRDLTWAAYTKRPNGKPRGYCRQCESAMCRTRSARKRAGEPNPPRPSSNAPPGYKWCYACKEYHHKNNFHHDRSQADGYADTCKAKRRAIQAASRERNRDKERARAKIAYDQRKLTPPITTDRPPTRGSLVHYSGMIYRVTAVAGERVQLSSGAIVTLNDIATA
jgi:hypothetical protein